jgi:tetratricopeptide (TPR) repeat protein
VASRRNFRILSGKGEGGDRRNSETERLDRFLDRLDPQLVRSLREDERRRHWLMVLAALVLGLLVGGGGMWLLRYRPAEIPASQATAALSEERAMSLVNQGKKLMLAKQFEKAWADLELATQVAPGLVDAWDTLALANFYSGQIAEAERAARKCLEIDPNYKRSYHVLGDISFYAGGDREVVKDLLRKAGSKRGVARMTLLEGRVGEALPEIRELVQEVPDDRYVQVMAEVARLGHLTPELRRMLEPTYAVSRNPETAQGWRLYYTRRYDEASTAFNRALQSDPRDVSANLGRGWCQLQAGTPAAARQAQSMFEGVLAVRPSNYSALNGLAWSRKAQGQAEGAVKLWERVLSLPHRPHIEIPETLKGLGMVAYEHGDYARASSYLVQSYVLNSEDPETEKLLNDAVAKLQAQ